MNIKRIPIRDGKVLASDAQAWADNLCFELGIPKLPIYYDFFQPTCYVGAQNGHGAFINVNPFCGTTSQMRPEIVLAHEIRHHWQHRMGMIKLPKNDPVNVEWQGRLYQVNHSSLWRTSPWEIDAVEFENTVVKLLGFTCRRYIRNGRIVTIKKIQVEKDFR